ncbi:hypothetical protein Bca4012_019874 [Brassica carinata]
MPFGNRLNMRDMFMKVGGVSGFPLFWRCIKRSSHDYIISLISLSYGRRNYSTAGTTRIPRNEDLTGVPKRIWRHPVEPEEPDVSSEHTMYHDIDQTVTLLCYILSYVLGREV